ncbi:translocation/assembly module TamB domain-containing protein [Pseudohaliea sp.]|uniref:translocation/assembly module TamB domain-containing protein n=1 Tax=Pseudohaliea sp. TaxID=2740289 RepID=UPI0032EC291C
MPKLARLALLTGLALILLVVLVSAGVAGLLATERGTRWVAGLAVDRLGVGVRWAELQGSLWRRVEFSDLAFEQPGLRLTAASAVLAWEPGALLGGELRVSALSLRDARLVISESGEDASPAGAFDPADARLPVDVVLSGVALERVTVVMPDAVEQVIDALTLEGSFRGDKLALSALQLRVPQGGLSLAGSAGLRSTMPVELTLVADGLLPAQATADGQRPPQHVSAQLSLDGTVDWHEEGLAAALAYRFDVQGVEGLVPELPDRVAAAGQLSARQRGDELAIETASLALDDAPLALGLHGTVSGMTTADPAVSAELDWKALRWPLGATATPLFASDDGRIGIAGHAGDYRVTLRAGATGAELPASRWEGRARGDTRGLVLETLRGELLGGWIEASGPVAFDPQPAWDLRIEAGGLDPAPFLPALSGPVEAALGTRGQLDSAGTVSAGLSVDALRATAAGFPVELAGEMQLAGEVLQVARLSLHSATARLDTSGSVSAEHLDLDWALAIADAGLFLPGARGRVDGEGRLLGSPAAPRAVARLKAESLGLDTLSVESVDLDLGAGLAADAPLTLGLAVAGVSDGDAALLDALTVEADGSNADHTLTIAARAPAAQLNAELEGGLAIDTTTWEGRLRMLRAESDAAGAWDLESPSPLLLAAQALRLEAACLQRRAGTGRVCLDGDWQSTGAGTLALALTALPVEAFLPTLTGELSGDLRAGITADGALAADGRFELGAGAVRLPEELDADPLPHGGGHLSLSVGDDGLRAAAGFAAPADGRVDLALRLPALRALPLAAAQPLEGRVQAALPDLAILAAFAEPISTSAGRLSADLDLAGSLDAPLLKGELRLSDGAATLPVAGLDLEEIELRLAPGAETPEQLALTGGLRSGDGRLEIAGSVDATAGTAAVQLRGEGLMAYNTADARVLVSPDLAIDWSPDLLSVRGLVTVPRAEITPRLQLGAATTESPAVGARPGVLVGPSPDVVILGEEAQPGEEAAGLESPLRIAAEVGLVLGRDVTVNALGLVTRLEGAIGFNLQPDQQELLPIARGGISLVDGTFRSFGQDLDIETGQVLYAGVPVTEPEVFLRAVRWIDADPAVSVVGVQLSGPATAPELELFSRPQLDTAEIQSYLLTGTGTGENSTVLAIGTQLTERVYVGYGYNLLEQTSEFDALFTITPRYGLGADVGEADSNFNLMFTHEN